MEKRYLRSNKIRNRVSSPHPSRLRRVQFDLDVEEIPSCKPFWKPLAANETEPRIYQLTDLWTRQHVDYASLAYINKINTFFSSDSIDSNAFTAEQAVKLARAGYKQAEGKMSCYCNDCSAVIEGDMHWTDAMVTHVSQNPLCPFVTETGCTVNPEYVTMLRKRNEAEADVLKKIRKRMDKQRKAGEEDIWFPLHKVCLPEKVMKYLGKRPVLIKKPQDDAVARRKRRSFQL